MDSRRIDRYTSALHDLKQPTLSGQGVNDCQQNLLSLLEYSLLGNDKTILTDYLSSTLDKVPLLLGMSEDPRTQPYRSPTKMLLTAPSMNERNDFQLRRAKQQQMHETITAMLDDHQTVYIKEQGVFGTRGQGVYRVSRQENELIARVQGKDMPLQQLLESMTNDFAGAALVEAGHKLHRIERGNTWEIALHPDVGHPVPTHQGSR